MNRVQGIILPILRAELPDVMFTSSIPDVDDREYPLVNIRRLGGVPVWMDRLDRVTVEIIAVSAESPIASEELYMDVRQVIWDAKDRQVTNDKGYIHSFRETVGPTAVSAPFPDTWMFQGLIQLGVRPPR